VRLAVFASGSGTTFAALADAAARGELGPTEITLLVSDRAGAGALKRAEKRGIATGCAAPDDDGHADDLLRLLRANDIDFIALAGYLRKVPPPVVNAFREKILNTHPALLPAFGGKGMYGQRVHEAVLDYGARWTGATIHLVEEEYDTGPVVLQQPVPVRPGDTPRALAERVKRAERRLYPEAVCLFATDRVTVEGRRVTIDDDPLAKRRAPDF
jgi:phosphoribosylglycinamide formyltransferase-1